MVLLIASCAKKAIFIPEKIIRNTLYNIHIDLKNIKDKYPQLSDIDKAGIKDFRFDYEKGFIKDDKRYGPTFEKYGTDILIEIRYPAKKDEVWQLKGSSLLQIKNGKHIKYWRLVRTERSKEGQEFCKSVNGIIDRRLNEMFDKLGYEPIKRK